MTVFWHACDKPHMFTFHPKTDHPGWFKVLPLREDPLTLASLNEIMLEACSHPKATFEDMESLTRRLLNTSEPIGKITRHGGVSEGIYQYKDAMIEQTLSCYTEEDLEKKASRAETLKEELQNFFPRELFMTQGGVFWDNLHRPIDHWVLALQSPSTMRSLKADFVGFKGNMGNMRATPFPSIGMWRGYAQNRIDLLLKVTGLDQHFSVRIQESFKATSPIIRVWYKYQVLKDGSVVPIEQTSKG